MSQQSRDDTLLGHDLNQYNTSSDSEAATNQLSDSASEAPMKKDVEAADSEEDESLGFRRLMVLIAMSFLWTASQIPLYFYGGVEPQILDSIGGYDTYLWITLANLIPLGIVTPFVGVLADLFGRKIIGMAAFILVIIGNIICATALSMNVFIVGSVFIGVGAGLGELIALAVAGEIAPAKKRGLYVGATVTTIIPFCPAVLYAQFIANSSTWRWIGLLIGLWSFTGLVLTFIFYKAPPRQSELSRVELAKRIDYVGGLLSAAGLTLFMLGLVFGAEQYSWTDAHVLAPFLIGAFLLVAFCIWEAYIVKYPMFPAKLKRDIRLLSVILLVTFVTGANFFALLIFWTGQYEKLYAQDNPVSQGVGSLPVGFGIIFGSMIMSFFVSIFKNHVQWIMIGSAVVMTAANGAMACATPDNLGVLWFIVTLACLGTGAVIVPNQVIATIICPPELIATVVALTISVRTLGGSIAYAIYYNILFHKFYNLVPTTIAPAAMRIGINSTEEIAAIADYIQGGSFDKIATLPGISSQADVDMLISVGKEALFESYPQVYYVSIAFGGVAIIASFFLYGVEKHMKGGAAVKLE